MAMCWTAMEFIEFAADNFCDFAQDGVYSRFHCVLDGRGELVLKERHGDTDVHLH